MPRRRGQQTSTRGLRTRGTRKAAYKRSAPGGRKTFAGGGRRGRPQSPMAAGIAGTAKPGTTTTRSAMATQVGGEADVRKKPWKKRRRRGKGSSLGGYNFTRNLGGKLPDMGY